MSGTNERRILVYSCSVRNSYSKYAAGRFDGQQQLCFEPSGAAERQTPFYIVDGLNLHMFPLPAEELCAQCKPLALLKPNRKPLRRHVYSQPKGA